MKRLFLFILISPLFLGCDMVFHQPKDGGDKQTDSVAVADIQASTLKSPTINPVEEWTFLYRIQATDPEGEKLTYKLISQTYRNWFSITGEGDVYISRSAINQIQKHVNEKIVIRFSVSDGQNETRGEVTFIVEKSNDGSHYLKRGIV